MNNIRLEEKHCIIKFLHKVARSDYKILEREINIIHEVATYLELDLDLSEEWVTQWGDKDFATFNELINSNSASLGQIIKWSTDVMNSDHIKHQNEQLMILNLIKESLDNPKYPKAISIPVTELDDTLIQMLHKTPEICHRKARHWQKNKTDKPLKRVAASISFDVNGKREFVTAVNYELSTPGGSRCAEQNAIGMMIALHPELRKEDVKDIIVYGGGGLPNPCWPCGICSENITKINVDNQINLYVYPADYQYTVGILPKSILKVKFTDFIHK